MSKLVTQDDLFNLLSRYERRMDMLERATRDEPDWVDLPFNSPWTHYSLIEDEDAAPGTWGRARYMMDAHGWVHIRGLVTNTAAYAYGGANRTIFTLPVGFRPYASKLFSCRQDDTVGNKSLQRIDLNGDGTLTIIDALVGGSNGLAGYLSLDSIPPFKAEQ